MPGFVERFGVAPSLAVAIGATTGQVLRLTFRPPAMLCALRKAVKRTVTGKLIEVARPPLTSDAGAV